MAKFRSICVYCGSKSGTNPNFITLADDLGRFFATHNITLIYGGGNVGLMGVIAKSVITNGGNVIGIIPQHLFETEIESQNQHGFSLDHLIITENMHERKEIMFQKSDAFITLPGSIGTLDETIEMITWRQLKTHKKPIFIVNQDNYWQPFFTLIDHIIDQGFTSYETKKLYETVKNMDELIKKLL